MLDAIKEWWGPLVGGAGMFASYVAGKERTRARIAEVSQDLAEVQSEVKGLRESMASQSLLLATISNDLKWIKANQEKGR